MTNIRNNAEFDFISWLRHQLPNHERLLIPPGDDAALLKTQKETLIAADMLLEGVHFDLKKTTPEQVGRKALAVNLSDIAAMAGTPLAVTISLALPKGRAHGMAEQLFTGIAKLAAEFDVAVAGGDTNAWNGPLVINISILGDSAPPPGSVTKRRGTKPGDWIFVTGNLGGSIFGHHLTFTPRVLEAKILNQQYALHSMIDISDGLAADLSHILTESRCGAVLDKDLIPISDTARQSKSTRTPLEQAMHDGEDFELCFTVDAETGVRILRENIFGEKLSLTKIGEATAHPVFQWRDGTPIERLGFQHAFC